MKHFDSLEDDQIGEHLTEHENVDWRERRGMPKFHLTRFWQIELRPRILVKNMINANMLWATRALDSWKYFIPDLESKEIPRDLIYLIVEFCGDIFDLSKEMRLERKK